MVEDGDFRVIFMAGDYPATIAFYQDILELPVLTSWDDSTPAGTIFSAGPGTLEVLGSIGDPPGQPPSGFRLLLRRPDPDQWCRRLSDKGVAITVPLVDRPWGYREFAVTDPNGIEVFIYTVTDPARAGHA